MPPLPALLQASGLRRSSTFSALLPLGGGLPTERPGNAFAQGLLQRLRVFWPGNEASTLEHWRALLDHFQPATPQVALPLRETDAGGESDNAEAPGSGELRAYLQPKVHVATAQVYGFEVLARWQLDDGKVLPPGEFIPALRRAGRLDAMLFELLRQAVGALLTSANPDLRLSFNVEAEQVDQPGFATSVEQVLKQLDINAQRITFELTESSPLRAPALSLENLLHLRRLGCGLAIDDFGCGYSTLQRLMELPFTELKLDRHLIADLKGAAPRRLDVVNHALALGRELGLKVIAEGVENEAQLRQLRQLGCDSAQGFLFGKPMPTSQLDAFLRDAGKRQLTEKRAGSLVE